MFKIEIEEKKIVRKVVDSDWGVISDEDGKKEMGYLPAKEKNVISQETIYTQQVETLDLIAVINAVNGVVPSQLVELKATDEVTVRGEAQLRITDVIDHDVVIAIEFSDGNGVWFMDLRKFPSLEIGPVPKKSLDEDFLRVPRITYV